MIDGMRAVDGEAERVARLEARVAVLEARLRSVQRAVRWLLVRSGGRYPGARARDDSGAGGAP
ncbi:hypothetical protein L6R50_18445 [Myxococcota bacterium]|nr:hypothetical protein [Myxococcota bacterium]